MILRGCGVCTLHVHIGCAGVAVYVLRASILVALDIQRVYVVPVL